MMNDQPLPAATPGADGVSRATGTRSEPSLARQHSRALYRPVPPVECDDDGYPFRDGAPVESTLHEELRTYASSALKARYAARDDVFVAAELGLFFERGNRKALLAPDALVSFGVNAEHRLSYKAWEEGAIPDFVLELLSARTWRRDVVVKPPLYEAIGVHEYWIFDPIGKLADPIVGRRLDAAGVYRPVQEQSAGGYRSEVLGLDLLLHGDGFRFRDPKTGEILSDHVEAVAQRRAAERARDEEALSRQAAERARDEEALSRQAAERARDEEALSRQTAERARDEETAARRAAEARIAQLEKLLRQR